MGFIFRCAWGQRYIAWESAITTCTDTLIIPSRAGLWRMRSDTIRGARHLAFLSGLLIFRISYRRVRIFA